MEPNEIQTVTSSAASIDEVQILATKATDVNEVQTISLSVELGITLGGSYTVVFDDSATGGSAQESGSIMVTAEASGANHLSVEEILEAMPNIGGCRRIALGKFGRVRVLNHVQRDRTSAMCRS